MGRPKKLSKSRATNMLNVREGKLYNGEPVRNQELKCTLILKSLMSINFLFDVGEVWRKWANYFWHTCEICAEFAKARRPGPGRRGIFRARPGPHGPHWKKFLKFSPKTMEKTQNFQFLVYSWFIILKILPTCKICEIYRKWTKIS